jgi:hypothetical protein
MAKPGKNINLGRLVMLLTGIRGLLHRHSLKAEPGRP